MIVPNHSNEKVKPADPEIIEPLPEFYTQTIHRTIPILFKKSNIQAILLVFILVSVQFYYGNLDFSVKLPGFALNMPVGWIILLLCIFIRTWFYFQIISFTHDEIDELAEAELTFNLRFFWDIFWHTYLFICAIAIAALPSAIIGSILETIGVNSSWIKLPLLIPIALLFPMNLLLFATGAQYWKLFRLDWHYKALIEYTGPYLLMAGITFIALVANRMTIGFIVTDKSPGYPTLAYWLAAKLLAAFLSVLSMRIIGLFGRHYFRAMPWYMEFE